MTAPENNSVPRKYRWPWVVLGFVVLGIALAVFWVALAVKKVAQQRETGEPIPTQSPTK